MASDAPKYHERQHLQHCLKHTLNNLLQQEAFTIDQLNQLSDSIGARRTWILGNYDANVLEAALALHNLVVKWHNAQHVDISDLIRQQSPVIHSSNEQCQCEQLQESHAESAGSTVQQQHDDRQQQQQQQEVHIQPSTRLFSGTASTPLPPQQAEVCAGVQQAPKQHQQQRRLLGLVLNVRSPGWWGALTGGRHWLAIRYSNGCWWNHDSKLPAPVSFAEYTVTEAAGDQCASLKDASNTDYGTDSLAEYLKQQLAEGAHVFEVYVA